MRIMILALLAATLGLFVAAPASAQMMDTCAHEPTIESLSACVNHAAQNDYIDNGGIARSLLAKLDAAQKALDRDQPSVAINNLKAFIHEVEAQSGKHIDAEHAAHMRMHAEDVIAALRQP
jgi:cell division FtsZ-interacting protein ZapD